MNISQLFGGKPSSEQPGSNNEKYATSFKRSTAAMIDIWVTLFLRAVAMQIMGSLWLKHEIIAFQAEFFQKFGTETVKNTHEHIDFVVHHKIFLYSILFYGIVLLIGAFYHAYFNSSSWSATLGKRIMKIMVVDNDGQKISLLKGLSHYLLSVLPFVYIAYLLSYQMRHSLSFYDAILASSTNVLFGIMFVLWVQIHFFTKRKTTAYDLICDTILVNGRSSAKLPWHKIEKTEENKNSD